MGPSRSTSQIVLASKHRAPKGVLRHRSHVRRYRWCLRLRKHRAPKGALRPCQPQKSSCRSSGTVRKHRAPKGALRLLLMRGHDDQALPGQKAPSAKRYIKTTLTSEFTCRDALGQKAPSAKRCIETLRSPGNTAPLERSESTERQKVH